MTDYQPLNCDLHDELEIAALRGNPVQLRWRELEGAIREATGVVRHIEAAKGEEFLVFDVNGELLRIRLDQLNLNSFPLRSHRQRSE